VPDFSKIALWIIATLIVLIGAYLLYSRLVMVPKDLDELTQNPEGVRAGRVMLLTLPGGTTIPVNYLQEDDTVFAGADGRWWRQLQSDGADGADVTMVIRGETLAGRAIVILDDPEYTHAVFARLRPAAPDWLPDWLNGKLIVIKLQS
jgi:hypothetical protein